MYIHICIYTVKYNLTMKKNEIMPFAATWMDFEGIMLSEMSYRERQILNYITYMWSPKIITN